MKKLGFFGIAFLVLTALFAYFWATDAPGSGMAWPTCICAALGVGGLIGDAVRQKSLNQKAGR